MSNTENPVDAAIRQAQEIATKAASAPQTLEMVRVDGPSAMSSYVAPKAPSLVGLTEGSMNVDGYLKVKEFGLLLMGKPNLVEKIKVAITPAQIQPFAGIRFQVGTNVSYLKSYDGVNCSSGGTWAEAVARAQKVDAKARPYEGGEIAMRLLEDAKDVKGAVVAEAGLTLGHTTSITNKQLLADFIKEAMAMNALNEELEVEVSFKPKTNTAGQTWGLVTFKIIGVLGESAAE